MLIAKRFDDIDGDYFEINTLLGYSSKEKYRLSVEEIFDGMQNYLNEQELEKLAKFYYFNFLVGNGDAHAKNFSVIKQGNIYKLSPLYDVVNTHIYGFTYPLGIPLRKRSFDENFCEKDLIFLLRDYIDVNVLDAMREKVAQRMEDYIDSTPFAEFERGNVVKQKLLDSLERIGSRRGKRHK